MNKRALGIAIILLTISSYFWLIMMIVDVSQTPPIISANDAIGYVSHHGWTYTFIYLNIN